MLDGRAADEGPANDGAVTSDLLDRGCAGLANHFVLRPGAARAADRPDNFPPFDEGDPAAGGNHAIECEGVVILFQLDGILKDTGLAPKGDGCARFML
jgi:hypothetical protein